MSDIESLALKKMGLDEDWLYNPVSSDNENNLDIIQQFIMTKREYIKEYFVNYWKNNIDTFDMASEKCLSSYAPVIITNATKTQINNLSRNKNVSKIYSNNQELSPSLNISRNVIRANTIQNSSLFGYTGDGIKIGVLEAGGLPDNSLIGLDTTPENIKIFYDPNVPYVTDWHANIVTMILAGQGLNGNSVGIAPDATIYATYEIDGGQLYKRLDWFVQQGVNIVNFSASTDPNNSYELISQLFDYYSYHCNITFCNGSGNFDTDGVGATGMSYNVITVGNTNDKNTNSISDDLLYPRTTINNEVDKGSSYVNLLNPSTASKPDICAPGTNIYTTEYGSRTGTSASAPHIAGLAALLCEQNPSLLYSPAAIKAILTAGVYKSNHAYVPSDRVLTTDPYNPSASYIQYGSGIANGVGSASIIKNESFDFGFLMETTTDTTYSINCVAGDDVRVSLAFLMNLYAPNDYSLPNLNIYIYDPSGNFVGSSITSNNNLEIVDFTANTTGNYTVRIRRISSANEEVYFGIAWLKE